MRYRHSQSGVLMRAILGVNILVCWVIRNGWLYNVSGFDAVELELASGKLCRIGTDEPGRLLHAIEQAAGL